MAVAPCGSFLSSFTRNPHCYERSRSSTSVMACENILSQFLRQFVVAVQKFLHHLDASRQGGRTQPGVPCSTCRRVFEPPRNAGGPPRPHPGRKRCLRTTHGSRPRCPFPRGGARTRGLFAPSSPHRRVVPPADRSHRAFAPTRRGRRRRLRPPGARWPL